jgi:hypothetical protein
MSTSPRDAGIPMLTEVIEEDITEFVGPPEPEAALFLGDTAPAADTAPTTFPAYALTFAASDYAQLPAKGSQYGMPAQFAPSYPIPLKPAALALPVTVEAPAQAALAPAPPPPSAMSEEEWQRMERRVRERILGQLLSRTDAMLEERIRSSMAGVLQQAVDGLAATLRASLHKTLEDVVSRAVAQEISRLQSPKK